MEVPNLITHQGGYFNATERGLGQTVINKISDLKLDDEELIQAISESSFFLNEVNKKYDIKVHKSLDDEIEGNVKSLIFHHNHVEDKFKIELMIENLQVRLIDVATQKNILAGYRNELREIIKISNDNPRNNHRIIDLTRIVQYLDLKILKIENDVEQAKFQIELLSKVFSVTFFHLAESVRNITEPKKLYLDTMYGMSLKKTNRMCLSHAFKAVFVFTLICAIGFVVSFGMLSLPFISTVIMNFICAFIVFNESKVVKKISVQQNELYTLCKGV